MKKSDIILGKSSLYKAEIFFNEYKNEKVFILYDVNVRKKCLDLFLSYFPILKTSFFIEIKSGEKYKSIQTVIHIVEELIKNNAEKNSLLINLGGGVVSDIGSFVASIYNRGINLVNVPTTLLSQVDASIGGKTSVNFYNIKNKIGTFYFPRLVIIIPEFLNTLSKNQLISGYGEIFKYSLIHKNVIWKQLEKNDFKFDLNCESLIKKSIEVKNKIIKKDIYDLNIRKTLNFGHTIGHAIESSQINHSKFSHGICVVIGMICESYISKELNHLPEKVFNQIKGILISRFPLCKVNNIEEIIKFIYNDKKNKQDKIKMVLIKKIGQVKYDISVSTQIVRKSLKYYNSHYD